MLPTNRLRFVERDCYIKNGEAFTHPFKERVLQQWWQSHMTTNLGWTGDMPVGQAQGEWRDVPLEAEQ